MVQDEIALTLLGSLTRVPRLRRECSLESVFRHEFRSLRHWFGGLCLNVSFQLSSSRTTCTTPNKPTTRQPKPKPDSAHQNHAQSVWAGVQQGPKDPRMRQQSCEKDNDALEVRFGYDN